MPVHYRAATSSDVQRVVELVNSAYRGDSSRAGWTTEADLLGGQRTDPATLGEQLAGDDGVLLLAEDGGQLHGCVYLQRREREA